MLRAASGEVWNCRSAGYALKTSLVERFNNYAITVIERMAYGFRDDAYFFRRIRASLYGNP